ncbi:MAG: restriction system-associated AAA family ATPase [Chromatiaceae bacterium]|nr:restriction system-associated AAA family ATPase [Chromatiaceae bacterium]
MKLLRLKITDQKGFRSLQPGFEHHFRSEWDLQKEQGFAPFVCAGPNGSGKSNLLEVLAAIFYQLEVLRVRRSFLPEALQEPEFDFAPAAFELDYLIRVPPEYIKPDGPAWARVGVWKNADEPVRFRWENQGEFNTNIYESFEAGYADILLPQYVLGYSSGENEILSLPFFKMRFIQFDEYWNALTQQQIYPGRPETRLAYLDNGFSQAILLCNLLFHDAETLRPFREDVGVEGLTEFRIIIRRSIAIDETQLPAFGSQDENRRESVGDIVRNNPALIVTDDEDGSRRSYRVNLMTSLEGNESDSPRIDGIIDQLTRCATCSYLDHATDTLYLDYYVNDATKQAFRENFDFEVNKSPIALFQALQVLLTLNLYTVSEQLKSDLYQSDSLYVSETVPTLASDQRIMRIKEFKLKKAGAEKPVLLKSLSDGEHQLLHSLGLCLLFRNTRSLFLLDEPETHFNPDWRSNFVTRLHQCFDGTEGNHEMLVTTHTPFLISDSKPEKVLVFKKANGTVSVARPDYNTLGASINKITMNTFNKRETIGGHAQAELEKFRRRFNEGQDKEQLIAEINQTLGDSVEKVLLIKTILDSTEAQG